MAIKGVAYIKSLNQSGVDLTKANLVVTVLGTVSGSPAGPNDVTLDPVDINVTSTIFASSIKSGVKTYMTSTYGATSYSFGLLDDVELIGGSLL